MGLMETSSKRAYAIPRSSAPRAPAPAAGHCWPIHPQEILRVLAQSVWVGCVFCAIPNLEELKQPGTSWVHCPRWAIHPPPWSRAMHPPPLFRPLIFLGVLWEHRLRYAVCLLWRADLRLRPAWWLSTIQDLRKTWLAAGSLLTVWWKRPSLGLRLQQPLAFWLQLLQACLSISRWGRAVMQQASSPLVFSQAFVLWEAQAVC